MLNENEAKLDGSAVAIVFLRAKHAGVAVRSCFGIPTG